MKIKIMRIGKGVAALLLCLLIVASMSFGAIPAAAASVDLSDLPEPGVLIGQTSVPDQGDQLVFHLTEPIDVDRSICIRFAFTDPVSGTCYIVVSSFFDWAYENGNYVSTMACSWYDSNYLMSDSVFLTYHTLAYSSTDLSITVFTDGSGQYFPGTYSPAQIFIEKGEDNMNVLEAILAVFTAIGEWIVGFIPTLFTLFYSAESGLTFLGVLAVAGLSFAVVFLFIGLIQRFLHFRG